MSVKVSHKRLKTIGLVVLEIILVLIFILFILVGFAGVYLTITDVYYQNFSSVLVFLFIILIVTFCAKGISLIERKLDEYHPWRTQNVSKEELKEAACVGVVLVVVLIFILGLNSYFELFPTDISSSSIVEILKVVIQTNGFLIALGGIVFAQMFWAIHNQMCNIQEKMLDEDESKKNYESHILALERKRRSMIIGMFLVITFFMISILISLSGMAQADAVESLSSNPYLTIPFIFLVFGVVLFLIFIISSKMTISERDLKAKKEKQNH